MSDSIAFDRAAEYYDATRGLSEEGVRLTTEALRELFADVGGPILEPGVGTGQVAIPLHNAGVRVVGLDLSRPMMARLLAKADGTPPFPLVEGDATVIPFSDDAFGGSYLRWVLHLIPDWPAAVRELIRVVRPGGALCIALGAYDGIRSEMQTHYAELTGVSIDPRGLAWDGWDELGAELTAAGLEALPDIRFQDQDRDDVERFMQAVEANRFSWTWAVQDDATRDAAAADVRRWAEQRWGPLGEIPPERFEWRYAVYRLPASQAGTGSSAYSST